MTERKLPTSDEIRKEIENITIYPCGKDNIGKKPVKGEQILSQDNSSRLEKGLRVAGGAAAFAAFCSLIPAETITESGEILYDYSSWLHDNLGTAGQFLTLTGGLAVAGGKVTQEIVTDMASRTKKLINEEGTKLKTSFVNGVSNIRKEGKKVSKKFQSFARRTISKLSKKKSSDLETTFEVYHPKQDGGEGVELSYIEFTKRKGRS